MRGSRKFFQWGPAMTTFVCFFNEERHYKRAIIGPPAKRHLNGVWLAGRWWLNIECWLGSFVVLQGIKTSIAKQPYIFVIFQGSRPPVPPPSESAYV